MVFNTFGGDKRDRTADLLNAIQALSQLSYTPIFGFAVLNSFCIIHSETAFVKGVFTIFHHFPPAAIPAAVCP